MTAESWLQTKVGEAPERLTRVMLDAIRAGDAVSIPDRLAEAALLLYARAVAGDGGREDAYPLLAADALLTHAFQAQAEIDPQGIAALADRWADGERLARLVR